MKENPPGLWSCLHFSGRCPVRHRPGRHKRWLGSRGTHTCLLCPQKFAKLAYRNKQSSTRRIRLYKRWSRIQVSTPHWHKVPYRAAAAVLCFHLNWFENTVQQVTGPRDKFISLSSQILKFSPFYTLCQYIKYCAKCVLFSANCIKSEGLPLYGKRCCLLTT